MLWLGLAVGLVGLAILILHAEPASSPRAAMVRAASVLFALLAIGCAFRLVAGLPIIEASELGIAIWFHGPYRRPFFAPWSRVHDIVLTRVGRGNALGIELIEDELFRIPEFPNQSCAPVREAARAILAWSGRAIGGDPREWVELLQKMRSVYGEPEPLAKNPASKNGAPGAER